MFKNRKGTIKKTITYKPKRKLDVGRFVRSWKNELTFPEDRTSQHVKFSTHEIYNNNVHIFIYFNSRRSIMELHYPI